MNTSLHTRRMWGLQRLVVLAMLISLSVGLVYVPSASGAHALPLAAPSATTTLINTLHNAATGTPLTKISGVLRVYGDTGYLEGWGFTTNNQGVYTLTFATPISQSVRLEYVIDGYVTDYYDRKDSLATADWVTLHSGTNALTTQLRQIPVTTLVNTLVDATTNAPIDLVAGTLLVYSDTLVLERANFTTNANGQYTLTFAHAISQAVRLEYTIDRYVTEFYDRKWSLPEADALLLHSGVNTLTTRLRQVQSTTLINTLLNDATGQPIGATTGNLTVYSDTTVLESLPFTTSASGVYTITFATPLSQSVRLAYAFAGYRTEYYDRKDSLATADPFLLHSGTNFLTTRLRQPLLPTLVNTLRNAATSQPIRNAAGTVTVYAGASELESADFTTDANGVYTLTLSTPISQAVWLAYALNGYISEYYNHKPTIGEADAVTLNGGINLLTAQLQPTPPLTLVNTLFAAATGQPLSNSSGTLVIYSGTAVLDMRPFATNTRGVFTTTLQPALPQRVRLGYTLNGYAQTYYNRQDSLATADPVTLQPGTTTISTALQLVSERMLVNTLRDTVTNQPITNTDGIVTFYANRTLLERQGFITNARGVYTITLHAPIRQPVQLQYDVPGYTRQYYDQQSALGNATPITLEAGLNTLATGLTPTVLTLDSQGMTPTVVYVTPGTTIVWRNTSALSHTLISGVPPLTIPSAMYRTYLPSITRGTVADMTQVRALTTTTEPLFTIPLQPGGVFSYTVTEVGAVPFYLSDTPSIVGRIIVSEDTQPQPGVYLDMNGTVGQVYVVYSNTQQLALVADAISLSGTMLELSPDGTQLLYVTATAEDFSDATLWVKGLASPSPHTLIAAATGWNTNPRWSPDGTQVAYIHFVADQPQLWVINSDGTNARQLSTTSDTFRPRLFFGKANTVAWRGDGTTIQYVDELGTGQAYEVNVTTGVVNPLVSTSPNEIAPAGVIGGLVKPVPVRDYDGVCNDNGYTTLYKGDYHCGGEGSGSHPGVDIADRQRTITDQTIVRSIGNGTIVSAGWNNYGWGNSIVIRYDNVPFIQGADGISYGGTVFASFSHLSSVSKKSGAVSTGEALGRVGTTGASTGIHLHFQVDKATAPSYPYWPCSLSGAACVNSTVGQANLLKHTFNPMYFVQTHSSDALPSAARRDFNGDGKTDLALWGIPNVGEVYVAKAATGQFANNVPWYGTAFGAARDAALAGDFDGNGKDDLLLWAPNNRGEVYVARADSTQDGFQPNDSHWLGTLPFGSCNDRVLVGDFDGDRKDDLALWGPNHVGEVWVALSTGSNFAFDPHQYWYGSGFGSAQDVAAVGDFNGDGKADLALWSPANRGEVYVARSEGDHFALNAIWMPSGFGGVNDQFLVGDFNGDGKDDIALWAPTNQGEVYVALSTGSGFDVASQHTWNTGTFSKNTGDRALVGDFNGDGKDDLALWGLAGQGAVYVALSTGSAFQANKVWYGQGFSTNSADRLILDQAIPATCTGQGGGGAADPPVLNAPTVGWPVNGATNIPIAGFKTDQSPALLQWQHDANGAQVLYSVMFENANGNLISVDNCQQIAVRTCDIQQLLVPGKTYHWRVYALRVVDRVSAVGAIWSFTTKPAPNLPVAIDPTNNAVNIPTMTDLRWTQTNGGDDVRYDVRFGTDPTALNLVDACQQITAHTCAIDAHIKQRLGIDTLAYNTTYYWEVTARYAADPRNTASGGIWSFTIRPNAPPDLPVLISPTKGATNQPLTKQLRWTGSDPDGQTLTYDVYLEANNPATSVLVCSNLVALTTCDPGTLNAGTHYYWRVAAKDPFGFVTYTEAWDFTTVVAANNPPTTPNTPLPASGATNQAIDLTLAWSGGDPDAGDTVTYTVYLDTVTPPVSAGCTAISATTCNTGALTYTTHYYWQVVARDSHNATTAGPVWDFTTGSTANNPPTIPANPAPTAAATNQAITTTLTWSGGDPDAGDTVTYTVYLDTVTPPVSAGCTAISATTCNPGTLGYATHYYWQVVARDSHNATTAGPVWDFTTTANQIKRVSVNSSGAQGNRGSGLGGHIALSSDGRFSAYDSTATNLVANDTNNKSDVFVTDQQTGQTVRVSINTSGAQSTNDSYYPRLSANGRYVVFVSLDTSLAGTATLNGNELYVHDRDTDADGLFDEVGAISTVLVSPRIDATASSGIEAEVAISTDGRYVTFWSYATNLVAGDTNGAADGFVYDRDFDGNGMFDEAGAGATRMTRVSVDTNDTQSNGASSMPTMSANGRYIAFQSAATNLVASDANGGMDDIFIRDRDTDGNGIFDEVGGVKTILASVSSNGTQGDTYSTNPTITADGRSIAFTSEATNLVFGDTNAAQDTFVYDRDYDGNGVFDETGAGKLRTIRGSVDSNGNQATGEGVGTYRLVGLSDDGNLIAFYSNATNLVAGDTNNNLDIFLHNQLTGTTTRIVANGGTEGNGDSSAPVVSGDGRYLAFISDATNLVTGDTNAKADVFVYDRGVK